jgi:hypothetical protein
MSLRFVWRHCFFVNVDLVFAMLAGALVAVLAVLFTFGVLKLASILERVSQTYRPVKSGHPSTRLATLQQLLVIKVARKELATSRRRPAVLELRQLRFNLFHSLLRHRKRFFGRRKPICLSP